MVSWKNHVGYSLEVWQDESFWIASDICFQNSDFIKHGLYTMDVQQLIQEHQEEAQKGVSQTFHSSYNKK